MAEVWLPRGRRQRWLRDVERLQAHDAHIALTDVPELGGLKQPLTLFCCLAGEKKGITQGQGSVTRNRSMAMQVRQQASVQRHNTTSRPPVVQPACTREPWPLELLPSILPFPAEGDPERQGDQFQIQPAALLLDIEGGIFKRVPAAKRESMRQHGGSWW